MAHSLKELQNDFFALLTGARSQGDADSILISNNQSKLSSRINIYRNNRRASHVNSLALTFKVCQLLLGIECFAMLAKHFLLEYPSRTQDLNQYGSEFPDFLRELIEAGKIDREHAYIADVAQLEWYVEQALLAANSDQVFEFSSIYPVHKIWSANIEDAEGQEVDLAEGGVRLQISQVEGRAKLRALAR